MYNFLYIFLCCIIVRVSADSNATQPETKIVGGTLATNRSHFAYQASLRLRNSHICGASILNKNHIITASHCCYNEDGSMFAVSSLSVVVGDLNIKKTTRYTVKRNIKKVYPHSKYNPKTIQNDIAIMEIQGTFGEWNAMMKPIDINPKLPSPSTVCVISGWGKLKESNVFASADLYYANIPILQQTQCKAVYSSLIKSGMFCAGYIQGGVDSCQGDSGGPLVCDNKLTGIVSWGIGCAQRSKPGVYTDVSQYTKWIKKHSSSSSLMSSSFLVITIVLASFPVITSC